MTKQAHMIVRGVVQGVGFRMYAQREARSHGLRGYVRNLPSGEVEIVAEGDRAAIERLATWARAGPPAADVEDVRVTYAEPTGTFADFGIRH
jgi:acylphosphatase